MHFYNLYSTRISTRTFAFMSRRFSVVPVVAATNNLIIFLWQIQLSRSHRDKVGTCNTAMTRDLLRLSILNLGVVKINWIFSNYNGTGQRVFCVNNKEFNIWMFDAKTWVILVVNNKSLYIDNIEEIFIDFALPVWIINVARSTCNRPVHISFRLVKKRSI